MLSYCTQLVKPHRYLQRKKTDFENIAKTSLKHDHSSADVAMLEDSCRRWEKEGHQVFFESQPQNVSLLSRFTESTFKKPSSKRKFIVTNNTRSQLCSERPQTCLHWGKDVLAFEPQWVFRHVYGNLDFLVIIFRDASVALTLHCLREH